MMLLLETDLAAGCWHESLCAHASETDMPEPRAARHALADLEELLEPAKRFQLLRGGLRPGWDSPDIPIEHGPPAGRYGGAFCLPL
jgi:hypothetical protein